MTDDHQTFSLGELRRRLRRRWWIVALLGLIGAAAGVFVSAAETDHYEATATVLVEASSDGADGTSALSPEVAARLVGTRGVAERVARELDGGRSAEGLLELVSARADDLGAFVEVTATAGTAQEATRVADAFAHQFVAARDEDVAARLEQRIVELERRVGALVPGSEAHRLARSSLSELRARAALSGGEAQVVDPAVARLVPGGRPIRSGLAGGALGVLAGLVLSAAAAALDSRVRTAGELGELAAAPHLAAIPVTRRGRRARRRGIPPVLAAPREPFERLRGSLLALTGEAGRRRIAVTSPTGQDDGVGAVAAGLALSLARAGLRVCAVETAAGRPGLSAAFGFDGGAAGMAEALNGASPEPEMQVFETAAPHASDGGGSAPGRPAVVHVVGAGAWDDGVTGIVVAGRAEATLRRLERDHDVVILACPPVLASGEALALIAGASGTLLLARHSGTERRAVTRAADVIAQAGGSLLGVVATAVPRAELAAEGYGPWPAPPPGRRRDV